MIEQIRCPQLVGRADELAFFRERCKEARLGRGSLTFVNGEAGIGKTRLVDEAVRRAKTVALRHAQSFCLEHARSPLGPLADIVRTLHAADDSILTVARNVRRILARLVPELESGAAPLDAQAQGSRSQYAAIAEFFRRFGERHPVVLTIEDAHWSDVSTTEFLKYFAAKVGAASIAMIVLTRAEGDRAGLFTPMIAELRRQPAVHVLDIEPLTAAEMQTFVGSALGTRRLKPEEVRDVRNLADGNPLFAEELLASALARPTGRRALPSSVREIFAQRIAQLHLDDRDILVEAAVIGRRFDAAFLAHLTKRPLARILLALRRARALQLIVEEAEPDEGVVFRHPLVRETLYATILVAEARRIHQRILGELEALPDRALRIAALAYHSWAAGETGAALAYNELAGDEACAQLATNEAAVFYERALACAGLSEARRASLRRKLAAAYSDNGWSGRAIDMYEHVFGHARETGDGETMAAVCFAIGREHAARADGDAASTWRARGLEIVATLPPGPSSFGAFAGAALASAWRGEQAHAEGFARLADAFTGPRPAWAAQDLHDARAALDILAGHGKAALARYRRACADAIASGSTDLAVRAHCNYADHARLMGELATARRAAEDALRYADEVLVPLYRPYVLVDSGIYNAQAGLLDLARRRLAMAENAAAGLDARRVHAHLVHLGLVLARALDDDALEERYADESAIADAFASREPWWIGRIAQLFGDRFGRLGRLADARHLIHRALTAMPTINYAHELAITAAAYGADADIDDARAKLAVWARLATPEYGGAFTDLFEAYLARRSGASSAGPAIRAAACFEKLGLPLWAADAYELGGERAAAVQVYLRIGSIGDIARLSAPRAAGAEQVQLTKREREVQFFVTHGHTNREIADELNLSERTVESHIRAILGKIGGRSRHDIMRLAGVHALR